MKALLFRGLILAAVSGCPLAQGASARPAPPVAGQGQAPALAANSREVATKIEALKQRANIWLDPQYFGPPGGKPDVVANTPPERVVMRVGTQEVTAGQIRDYIKLLPATVQRSIATQGLKAVGDQYSTLLLLAQQAVSEGLDQSPEFKQRMEFQRLEWLAQGEYKILAGEVRVTPEGISGGHEDHQKDLRAASRPAVGSNSAAEETAHKDVNSLDATALGQVDVGRLDKLAQECLSQAKQENLKVAQKYEHGKFGARMEEGKSCKKFTKSLQAIGPAEWRVLNKFVSPDMPSPIRDAASRRENELAVFLDEVSLESMAVEAASFDARLVAIRHINNQGFLSAIALTDSHSQVRTTAIETLKDQNLLLKVLTDSHDWRDRKLAFGKLQGSTLENLMEHATDPALRIAAEVRAGKTDWVRVFNEANIGDALGAVALVDRQAGLASAVTSLAHRYILQGDVSRIPELKELLGLYGDVQLAEDYLNCGQSDLDAAGSAWAGAHGYSVQIGNGSHRVIWGGGHP